MSSSTPSTSVAANPTKGSSKATKIIKLRLPPQKLSAFPHEKPPGNGSAPSSTSTPSAPSSNEPAPSLKPSESADTPTPGVATTTNGLLEVPPHQPSKRKGIPGPKPGAKRNFQQASEGAPKPRGKPGPKKKPRPGDIVDGQPYSGPAPASTVKLNPKASTGAINERLRALDRTGTKCRKWARRGFYVKSFTGVQWAAPSWKAPPKTRADNAADVKSDSSSDGAKVNQDSSAVPSEGSKSNVGDTPVAAVEVGSSPAPLQGIAA